MSREAPRGCLLPTSKGDAKVGQDHRGVNLIWLGLATVSGPRDTGRSVPTGSARSISATTLHPKLSGLQLHNGRRLSNGTPERFRRLTRELIKPTSNKMNEQPPPLALAFPMSTGDRIEINDTAAAPILNHDLAGHRTPPFKKHRPRYDLRHLGLRLDPGRLTTTTPRAPQCSTPRDTPAPQ